MSSVSVRHHWTLSDSAMQDMRQKFDAEDPAEVTENKQQDKVDRSQGAARAISVCVFHYYFLAYMRPNVQ